MGKVFSNKISWLVAAIVVVAVAWMVSQFNPAALVASQQQENDELIAEGLARQIGALAYVYGYPMVDMAKQMHNETHRVGPDQQTYAPVNRFYRFPEIVGPHNGANFRMPNNDTLYFSGWFDIAEQPLIIHTPDTAGRYFTIAVTNLYSEVTHIGRRTHGTREAYYALVAPGWQGQLPNGVTRIDVESERGWLLGRVLVDGPADLQAALSVMNNIWSASLDEFTPSKRPGQPEVLVAEPIDPLHSLAFFTYMNRALKTLPPRPDEAALMSQFDLIGIGPNSDFNPENLNEATRRGLLQGLKEGMALVKASEVRTTPSQNGWMIPRKVGRYGHDYLQRASVVANGYGNLPEESTYAAALTDGRGDMMSGKQAYQLHLAADDIPPVDGFWSLTAYALPEKQVQENDIGRYSIGDRTQGLNYNEDGSLTLLLQHQRPQENESNWLPVPDGYFMVIMRMYEPSEAILSGEYRLPRIELQ